MNKKFVILSSIFILYTLATVIYNFNFNQFNKPLLSDKTEIELESLAIAQIKAIYPEFEPDGKDVNYVSKSKSSDKWYAYMFDKRDGGLGYEVYYEDGVYTTNFNKDLLVARLKLIDKMNQLMPENREYNQYVTFNPFGIKGKMRSRSGVSDGMVRYAIYKEGINIDEQLKIDYQILKYSSGLLKELGFDPVGIYAAYYEVPQNKVALDFSKTNLFKDQERGSDSFYIYFEELKSYKPTFKYNLATFLNNNLPASEEAFIQEAKKDAQ